MKLRKDLPHLILTERFLKHCLFMDYFIIMVLYQNFYNIYLVSYLTAQAQKFTLV